MMLRFSIRNLLIGTTWFALWGTLLLNYNLIVLVAPISIVPCWVTLIVLPIVAIGSIFGNAKGAVIIAFFALFIFLSFAGLIAVVIAQISQLVGN
jgi:hypothetical protein